MIMCQVHSFNIQLSWPFTQGIEYDYEFTY
jgi:hypothetical protein